MKVAIADLGVGNLRSVEHAVSHVASDAEVVITADAAVVAAADRLIIPGQGAIGTWFSQLQQRGLREAIASARHEKPIFGICVGMQAMFDFCAEDDLGAALGWVSGRVEHFGGLHTGRPRLKIPHMGWNRVKQVDHPIWHKVDDHSYFYFVHSYCAMLDQHHRGEQLAGVADYGGEFIAAVADGNVFATQFHPEKSQADGLQLLRNFMTWNGA